MLGLKGLPVAPATASCQVRAAGPARALPAPGAAAPLRAQAGTSCSSRCSAGSSSSSGGADSACAGLQPQRAFALGGSLPRPLSRSSRGRSLRCRSSQLAEIPSTEEGTLISKTEVAAFIQRDDFMDQIFRWAMIEAGEGGIRNFGLPMEVEAFYNTTMPDPMIWGFRVSIYKEGAKLTDLCVMFDSGSVLKHEWVGRDEMGFPMPEGKSTGVLGEFFEIWKLDKSPVDEPLRATIKSFCTGMVSAINRYYAFGSVFVDDAQ